MTYQISNPNDSRMQKKGKAYLERFIKDLKIVIALSLLMFVASGSKCVFPVDEIQEAINKIDRGIDVIHGESDKWNSTVRDIADNFPKEAKELVRNELTQLVQRSIMSAGVEFRCETDFLANRAIQGLLRIKAILKKEKPPEIVPSFCQISPSVLDLNVPPASRSTVVIAGYDMDQKDAKNNLLKYVLYSDITKQKIDVDNSRVGRTTHYENIINASGSDWEKMLKDNKITKIQLFWNDTKIDSAEVLIISKKPQKKEIAGVNLGEISLTPKHVRGDADFNVHNDKPMSFHVIGEAKIEDDKIMTRIYMNAREERPDWTQVEAWSEWNTAYTAPHGWKIISFAPQKKSERKGLINQNGARKENLPSGELVTIFNINGDRDGNEAGTWTGVTATFNNQVKIRLEEDFVPAAGAKLTRNKTMILPLPQIQLSGSDK